MKVISVENVSKKFILAHDRPRNLADAARGLFRRSPREDFWALKDVSFEVEQGEALGIIGHNGAGKSTMLKLLTRIMQPTSGRIRTRGRVSALIEVGAGFHPEMTGRENIYLNGSILGMTRSEIDRKLDEIVSFAELEKFIDTPVKRYSSGMYARLGFAVAAHVDPEILVVDEVLSVGDGSFQERCTARMSKLREDGATVVFVSHNLSAVSALCDVVLVLCRGEALAMTQPMAATAIYRQSVARGSNGPAAIRPTSCCISNPALVVSRVASVASACGPWEARTGGTWELCVTVELDRTLASPDVGFRLYSRGGLELARPCTLDYGYECCLEPGEHELRFCIDELPLQPGHYTVDVFAWDRTGSFAYDDGRHAYPLTVLPGLTQSRQGVRFGAIALCGEWSLRTQELSKGSAN